MKIPVACPSCNRKLQVKEKYLGRKIMCPHCEEAVRIPLPASEEELIEGKAASPGLEPEADDRPYPLAARLGIAALALGAFSVLLLCLPVIGRASPALSALGLLAGSWGLLRSRKDERLGLPGRPAGGAAVSYRTFGDRVMDYPLAGVVLCLLTLAVCLWTSLHR